MSDYYCVVEKIDQKTGQRGWIIMDGTGGIIGETAGGEGIVGRVGATILCQWLNNAFNRGAEVNIKRLANSR